MFVVTLLKVENDEDEGSPYEFIVCPRWRTCEKR